MTYSVRKATLDDVPVLERLIAESARVLTREDYTDSEIEGAIGTAWGVDTELIRDGTYYVVETEADGVLACGGWGRRKTLFGVTGARAANPKSWIQAASPLGFGRSSCTPIGLDEESGVFYLQGVKRRPSPTVFNQQNSSQQ